MTPPPPPLLMGFDFTALVWAAIWALVFSASLLPSRRRWQARNGQTPTPWWVVLLEGGLGGLVGGVVFALAIPEFWAFWRGPGKQAVLAVAGAAVGPLLGTWLQQAIAQIVAYVSERKFGVKIVVQTKEAGEDDGEKTT